MNNVIPFLRELAKKEPLIEKLILFGSRAREDYQTRSDYDVAVVAPNLSFDAWSRWAGNARENVPTLCGLDLVLLNAKISTELRKNIESEGKVFYDRNSKK